jgi:hypothetical protein
MVGLIDELNVFSRIPSDAEMLELFNHGKAGNPAT